VAQRLHCLHPIEALIDIHGVQEWLIKAGLVFLGDDEDLELLAGKLLRQFGFLDALVHSDFGEFLAGIGIDDLAGKGDYGRAYGIAAHRGLRHRRRGCRDRERKEPRSDLKRPWAAVQARAKLGGVRLHDLRHTHASFGAAGGLGLPIIGKLLGHKRTSTTARYAHLDIDPLRRASEHIGGRIAAALGELGLRVPRGKVVRL